MSGVIDWLLFMRGPLGFTCTKARKGEGLGIGWMDGCVPSMCA